MSKHQAILMGASVLVLGFGGCVSVAKVAEPVFAIVTQDGDFEVRRYGARVVAETRVEGTWEQAGNTGFRRLAGYIFGKNTGGTKIAMTAPVGERAAGRKLAMTAPVGERADADGWLVTFTMPEGETLATLPEPHDERVRLRELTPTRVAVVRFSGRWTESRMREHTEALRGWLAKRGLRAEPEPEINRYDPPWIPWFMRRNEVWLTLTSA